MPNQKFRRHIAWEAARLVYGQQETDLHRAKLRAARQLYRGFVRQQDLPQDAEVRAQVEILSQGSSAAERLQSALDLHGEADRFEVYRALLAPLEHVRLDPRRHPEGDALYHSLQVFALAREELPYDEEFLLAALLHDVGKAIDPLDHGNAGLAALEGHVTERTAWLIENHSQAQAILDGTIGVRALRRLSADESYDELRLLAQCDRAGRQRGAAVPELDEALEYLRDLAEMYDE
jgi:hypothetical protein